MVGDTGFDIIGGQENELSTIAVTYGFGKEDALHGYNPDFMVDSVDELYSLISS